MECFHPKFAGGDFALDCVALRMKELLDAQSGEVKGKACNYVDRLQTTAIEET